MSQSNHGPAFPRTRMRRNRATDWSRRLVREHTLTVDDLIWPVFVQEGEDLKTAIPSMPGVHRYSIDLLVEAVLEAEALGIPAVAIFPVTPQERKTPGGEESFNPNNLICRAVRAVKAAVSNIGIICDVALDPFTTHGQDGLLVDGEVLNDETLAVLCKQAVNQADAGCDIIAAAT